MENTYAINIIDNNGTRIGELMNATPIDIIKYNEKGFTVINRATDEVITSDMMTSQVGTSDGFINIDNG